MLLVGAAGLAIAGTFTTDPITVSTDAATGEGKLHNLGGTLGVAMPVAAAVVGWSLARNRAWSSARPPLTWATALAVLGFLASFSSLSVLPSQHGGRFGPEVLVGWPNRLETLASSVWLMVVAWQAAQLRQQPPAVGGERG